jgi:polyhydroxyalkanoate synthesis repressor PhaR
MPVIKRYSNRKMYDTESKRYVTLDDLGEFIRQGEDVRVVDHVTGEDLTSVTLLQVIFEEEKKIGGLLPQLFLTRLIRAGGSTVSSLRSRLASLDPFQVVDEEIRRRLQVLVEEGRIDEDEGSRIYALLVRKPPQPEPVRIPIKSVDGEEVLTCGPG